MSTKSVLVVDDEESLLEVLSEKFKETGVEVFTATNGTEALAQAFAHHPDIIVLDIVMPEVDGFEVMKRLHEDDWGKTVPIVLLTNSSSFETISKAVGSGMSEYIVKTEVKLDEIVARVMQKISE